jgi:hypothetical protein
MLLNDGELQHIGEPAETALRYYRVNFAATEEGGEPDPSGGVWDVNVDVVDAHLRDATGARSANVEQGVPIDLSVQLAARRELVSPIVGLHVLDAAGNAVFGFNLPLTVADGEPDRIPAGRRFRIGGTIENPLVPGRYFLHCYIARNRTQGDYALHFVRLLDFVVYGTRTGAGSVLVDADVRATLEPEDEA